MKLWRSEVKRWFSQLFRQCGAVFYWFYWTVVNLNKSVNTSFRYNEDWLYQAQRRRKKARSMWKWERNWEKIFSSENIFTVTKNRSILSRTKVTWLGVAASQLIKARRQRSQFVICSSWMAHMGRHMKCHFALSTLSHAFCPSFLPQACLID